MQKTDIFSEEELANVFKDQDAVMSSLGVPQSAAKMPWRKLTFYEDSIKSIVGGMRKAGLERLICVTAAGTKGRNTNLIMFFSSFCKDFIFSILLLDLTRFIGQLI